MTSKLAQTIAQRYLQTRTAGPVDPNIAKAAASMVEELEAAEEAMSRALRFSRILMVEPAVEWIPEQLLPLAQSVKELKNSIQESVNYLSSRAASTATQR